MRSIIRSVPLLFQLFAICEAYAQPSPKVEFEVASIKASPPPDGGGMSVFCKGGPGSNDPGLFTCQNMSLPNLITMAYGVSYYQVAPLDWMTPMRPLFNIDAKVPPATTKAQLSEMMRNLLADRFKLEVHRETRELPTTW
jgi:uncharacterized protein (TIGR03435 family)